MLPITSCQLSAPHSHYDSSSALTSLGVSWFPVLPGSLRFISFLQLFTCSPAAVSHLCEHDPSLLSACPSPMSWLLSVLVILLVSASLWLLVVDVFLDSTTDFTVDASSVAPNGEGKVRAIITNPSGTKNDTMVSNNEDGTYKVAYAPYEEGMCASNSHSFVLWFANPILHSETTMVLY